MSYENLTRLAFMGGSVIYNPDLGVDGHLAGNVRIAVRLSRVEINKNAAKLEDQYKETSSKYGYVTVTSVDSESITLSYSEYTATGVLRRNVKTITIMVNGTGDIDNDGKADVLCPAGV